MSGPRCLCCGEPGNVRCPACDRSGCTFGQERCHASLLRAIADRRQDADFMARLREQMSEDKPLLDRIAADPCGSQSAHLVESHGGGSMLVYECDGCGARLVRSREQAEASAVSS